MRASESSGDCLRGVRCLGGLESTSTRVTTAASASSLTGVGGYPAVLETKLV